MNSILEALAPLASLYLMHMILKAAGLGGLTKLSGSVGLATQAAFKASGDKNWQKASAGAIDKAAGKIGGRSSYSKLTGQKNKADLRALERRSIRKAALGAGGTGALAALAGGAGVKGALTAGAQMAGKTRAAMGEASGARRLHRLRSLNSAIDAGQVRRNTVRALNAGAVDPATGQRRAPHDLVATRAQARLGGANFGAHAPDLTKAQKDRQSEMARDLATVPLPYRAAKQREMVLAQAHADSDALVAATWGPEMVGRPIDEPALEALRANSAQALGLHPDNILVSSAGYPPVQVPGAWRGAATTALAIEAMRSPVHWLPPAVRERRVFADGQLESPDQYSARLNHAMVAAALLDPVTGQQVDMLAKMGYDTNKPGDYEKLAALAEGRGGATVVPNIPLTAAITAQSNAAYQALDLQQTRASDPEMIRATVGEQREIYQDLVSGAAAGGAAVVSTTDQLSARLRDAASTVKTTHLDRAGQAEVAVGIEAALAQWSQQFSQAEATRVDLVVAQSVMNDPTIDDAEIDRQREDLLDKASAYQKSVNDRIQQQFAAFQKALESGEAGAVAAAANQITQTLTREQTKSASSADRATSRLSQSMDHAEKSAEQRVLDSLSRGTSASQRRQRRTATDARAGR